MQKEDIRNGKRSHRLSRSRPKAHQNSRSQKAAISRRLRSPDSTGKVDSIADNIDRPPSILIDKWHPDQVASPLHQSCSREEESRLIDSRPETTGQLEIWEEFLGCFNDGYGRTCSEEIADHHCKTDDESRVVFL
jgi:hypothetical protein